jgi:hypothetical protein
MLLLFVEVILFANIYFLPENVMKKKSLTITFIRCIKRKTSRFREAFKL